LKTNIKTTFYIFSIIQFFSGYIYPVDYIPVPLRYLVYINPFFYGIDCFRQLLRLDYFLEIPFYSKLGLVSFITVILVLGVKIISSKNWKWDNT
ncbi:MAG: ABC transporter permease, partial [Lactococcus sp.]|nr:ABC transporter permease [Lactococcus sp.]